jgi:exopolyphosphatase/guanosine-5'-triphosphate,3'-diphosphate pyrophosphatase
MKAYIRPKIPFILLLAAIDIGSNAARLLINEVYPGEDGEPEFSKINLVRVPLRLGFDVFDTGFISPERTEMLIETMKSYRHLLNAYGVEHHIACATSAMRDARNAVEVLDRVSKETGFEIEVVSGEKEATLIYENHFAETFGKTGSFIYIDVGGGSTELTMFMNGRLQAKRSFDIGTIRLLKEMVGTAQWDEMKEFLKEHTKGLKDIRAIGSGGNINKVFSLSRRKEGKPLELDQLRDYHRELGSISVERRMKLYKLREDRADVIVPALSIYINAMRWAGCTEIHVPKIGLADGLIHHLYDEIIAR